MDLRLLTPSDERTVGNFGDTPCDPMEYKSLRLL